MPDIPLRRPVFVPKLEFGKIESVSGALGIHGCPSSGVATSGMGARDETEGPLVLIENLVDVDAVANDIDRVATHLQRSLGVAKEPADLVDQVFTVSFIAGPLDPRYVALLIRTSL